MSGASKEERFWSAVGNRIATARESSGLTQADLAKKIGLSRTAVTNIEAGRQGVSFYRMTRIAKALGEWVEGFLP